MASRSCCSSCLRTLRRRTTTEFSSQPFRQTGTQVRHRNAAAAPKPLARPSPKVTLSKTQPKVAHPATATAAKSAVSNAPPQAKTEEAPSETAGMINTLAKQLKKAAPSLTEPYSAYGVCELLVKECARVADYKVPQREHDGTAEVPMKPNGEEIGVGSGWWYDKFGLTPTFNTWAQVTLLHMYLLTVRMRAFPPEHYPTWNQQLTDHFFYVAEERMTSYHAIHSSMMRNRYLKDLFEQYRGLTVAYDQGLVKGDATLATAVWRNVCKGEKDVDLQGLAQIVSYMRSVVSNLEKMGDQAIVSGDVVFGDPGEEEAWVKVKSRSLEAASIKPTREAPQVQAAPGKAKARA